MEPTVHGMAAKNDAPADEERTRALIDKARAQSRLSDEASADPPPPRPERFRDWRGRLPVLAFLCL